ncbi:MAG: hypothetical protein AAGF35_08565, partial [Pseudomonadota bacterium]
ARARTLMDIGSCAVVTEACTGASASQPVFGPNVRSSYWTFRGGRKRDLQEFLNVPDLHQPHSFNVAA